MSDTDTMCVDCGERPRRVLPDPIPEGLTVSFAEAVTGQSLYCWECLDDMDRRAGQE